MGRTLDASRKELAERSLGLVEEVLSRAGLRADEDARGAGSLGLCRAAALWEPDGGEFAAFARRRIAEEIDAWRRSSLPLAGAVPFREPAVEDPGYRLAEARMMLAAADAALPGLVGARPALAGRMALRGADVRAVAVRLGMSRQSARRALCRCARALRRWEDRGTHRMREGGRPDGRDPLD